MLEAIQGENLGEKRGNTKRTCYPNEYSLTRDYGQRIDHVIVEKQSCNLTTKIVNFEVLQEFGASRKNCSDHCK